MGRSPRTTYSGAHYHITARGNRRGNIFSDDDDRRLFLALLGEACVASSWRCLSYCLMGNHFHLVLRTDVPSLSEGMHWLNGNYARLFNRTHDLTGHLFGQRFYASLIEDDAYLLRAIRYTELNPVVAGFCRSVDDWRWSSYGAVVGQRRHRDWFDRGSLLRLFGDGEPIAVDHFRELIAQAPDPTEAAELEMSPQQYRLHRVRDAFTAGLPPEEIARRTRVPLRTVRRILVGSPRPIDR